MARSSDWNEGLARRLRKRSYAREFVLACMEEGLPIQVGLKKVVLAYGVQEYAKKINMAPSNLVRALSTKKGLNTKTLEQILKPLDLELSLRKKGQVVA